MLCCNAQCVLEEVYGACELMLTAFVRVRDRIPSVLKPASRAAFVRRNVRSVTMAGASLKPSAQVHAEIILELVFDAR